MDVAGRTVRVWNAEVALTRKDELILAVLMDPPADDWKATSPVARRVFCEEAKQSAGFKPRCPEGSVALIQQLIDRD